MCIQTNNVITDGSPIGFETDEFYFKSADEMYSLFSGYESALENSVKIAEMCNFDFEFGKTKLPAFKPDNGMSPKDYLRQLAKEGLERKLSSGHIVLTDEVTKQVYLERIDYELAVIGKMGYDEYFLIVWDFVNYAKNRDIPVGPGRGSGAGSLVAYLIGITDVDSIKFDLLFERFLNPERVSMPDFDIDFCYDRRDEVIDYVRDKYGEDRVVQIITFGTLAARAAVRDVGRALGMPYSEVDKVAKEIPQRLDITIEKALKENKELSSYYDTDVKVKRLIDTAAALEGMPRHASTHAAGVVITDRPVTEYVPIAVNSGSAVTQFDMDTIAELGILKFDFLALRYLTIIHNAESAVKERIPEFDLSAADVNDSKTYKMLSSGHTDGVFQLESAGMRQMLTKLRPENIDDIIAAIALYRPGPMDSIPKYIEARHGKNKAEYSIPALAPILDNTFGCIVYQEQVMRIFREIAGYSFGHADIVRRAISKKKSDVLNSEKAAFISGAASRGIDETLALELFDDIVSFANYAFNKSHAAAYAVLSFRTAYLKCHYPREYYAALLTSVFGSVGKISEYTAECRKIGVKILPPDVNASRADFCVEGDNIRYGLLSLKNIGLQFVNDIMKERAMNGSFADFDDFVDRMRPYGMNKKQLEALIKSGTLDSLGAYRSQMLAVFESVMSVSAKNHDDDQLDLFSIGNDVQLESVKTTFPSVPEFSAREKLLLERESCGVYLSGHILDDYSKAIDATPHISISEIHEAFSDTENDNVQKRKLSNNSRVSVIGIVTSRTNKVTKSGDNMAFVTLEDQSGEIELICFSKICEEFGHMLIVNSVIALEASVNIKDDEDAKLIPRMVTLLEDNSEYKEVPVSKAVTEAPAKIRPSRLFVKIPSQDCREYRRIKSFLTIFNDGDLPVIFYDSEKGIYLKESVMLTRNSEFIISELKSLAGSEIVVIKEQLERLEEQIKEIAEKLGALIKQRDEINNQLVDLKTNKQLKIADVEKTAEQIESFKARRRELEPIFEATRKELEDAGVVIEQLEPTEMSIDEINAQITKLQKKMDDLGAVNMRAVEEYDAMLVRQTELNTQIETLSSERKQIMERMQGYEDLKKETFLKTYNNINENFKDVFHKLSDGEGTLILESLESPFTGGLTIEAQPRDKKKQRLESMSGGEKSLTALAFVFAIQRYMPAPFYAFDEVDANLDGINVERLASIVQLQAKDTQFIVVSHRKPMIESANRTIGVTQKEKGISKVTGVKLRD